MNYKTFLVEIHTEEIPAQKIREIAKNFYKNFEIELKKNKIIFSKIHIFDSPRRIALQIKKFQTSPIIQKIKKKGPAIKYAYHNGKLSNIAKKWLKKNNINIKKTKILETEKGKWLLYNSKKKIIIKKILPKIIISAIQNIPIKQKIQWSTYTIKFIRPIKNIIILLDNQFISLNQFNIPSKKYLYGNLSICEHAIKINHAKEYENILYKAGNVIANFNIRKKIIKYKSKQIAYKKGGKIICSNNLLEEITCLVEWPNILCGTFNKRFLKIPKDIIIYVIEHIQKYIPIYNMINNQLTEKFIIISNVKTSKPNTIISGNERVLHARLSDIEFFLKNDQKIKLKKYFLLLKKIIFHEKLGTMFQKTIRLINLIQYIAKYTKCNIKDSMKCALLSKCDLKTNMVYEFPKLKGIIGMYYALHNGENENIAISLKEQYQPKFSGDQLPSSILGYSLSITDKIDTIVGLFLIQQTPKKDNDPFGLRRLTIGVIRIIIEKKININLYNTITQSMKLYNLKKIDTNIIKNIIQFIINRLYVLYQEKKYNINIINAILKINNNNLYDINNKIKTLSLFQNHTLFNELIITYKRISNLIKKTALKININNTFNIHLINHDVEHILYIKTKKYHNIINILLKKKKYKNIIEILFKFNILIKNFLNQISIQHSEQNIKINRIILLIKIQKLFLIIADFQEI